MSKKWPVFRTPIHPFNITQVWAAILATIFTLILVPLLGYFIAMLVVTFAPPLPLGAQPENVVVLFGSLLLGTGSVAWLGMIFGVPASFLAQRKGWAGWGIALLAGLISGAVVGAIVGLDSATGVDVLKAACVVGPIGLVYAGIYWLLFRLLYPKAFLLAG